MYNEELETLIDAALADGELTEKEKQILFKKAQSMGIDLDEFEIVLDGRFAKIKKEQKMNLPRTEKLGNIVVCPACGANIPGGSAVCPECGHEFRHVEANSSLQKLSKLLEEANEKDASQNSGDTMKALFGVRSKQSHVENVLSNFPVPNTSDDLLEVLAFVQGNAKRHNLEMYGSGAVVEFCIEHAYWLLYEKCITKAKLSFAKDARFQVFYENYEIQKKCKTPEKLKQSKGLMVCGLIFLAIFLMFGLLGLIM